MEFSRERVNDGLGVTCQVDGGVSGTQCEQFRSRQHEIAVRVGADVHLLGPAVLSERRVEGLPGERSMGIVRHNKFAETVASLVGDSLLNCGFKAQLAGHDIDRHREVYISGQ